MTRNELRSGASTQEIIWAPQPGPQVDLITCPLPEVLFGGSRGGGKTDAVIGKWAKHADEYAESAHGVIFRRTFKQLEEVLKRTRELYPRLGATYSVTAQTWTFPNGATLKLRHLDNVMDAQAYQGHQYCVQEDTLIKMGDGSLRALRDVAVGDFVLTAEGPRRVTHTHGPWVKPCIRVLVRSLSGELIGEQVQPLDHRFLTIFEETLQADDDQASLDAPLQQSRALWQDYITLVAGDPTIRQDCENGSILGDKYKELMEQHLADERLHHIRTRAPALLHDPNQKPCVDTSIAIQHLDLLSELEFAASSYLLQHKHQKNISLDHEQSLKLCHLVRQTKERLSLRGDDDEYDLFVLQIELDYLGRYCVYHGRYGGQLLMELANALCGAPLLNGVETPIHQHLNKDVLDYTHECNRWDQSFYDHPYKKEQRPLAVSLEEVEVEVGSAYTTLETVRCLTVDSANHYITSCGLLNSQTFLVFEEATNWPTSAAIDMLRATLRSAKGVPTQIILTANPGGPGHNWVKERYITPAKNGYKIITDYDSQLQRVYIPSRLTDNKILTDNDPTYAARLRQTGAAHMVKAWLEGDWDIVAGGFFDDVFSAEKHIVPTFHLPNDWQIITSFDWGFSAPSSMGVFARVTSTHDKLPRQFPRGSLIRVRELYTVQYDESRIVKPNIGKKLTNEDLGAAIARMLKTLPNPKIAVADPSIFTEQGGPSAYDRMRVGARMEGYNLQMTKADNNRITGWSRVREMLQNAKEDIPEKSGLWVMDNCEHWLRTVPTLQSDRLKPDDVDTEAEDHAADDTRYACMIRSRAPRIAKLTGW